jgi:acyl-CoA thioesterase-1
MMLPRSASNWSIGLIVLAFALPPLSGCGKSDGGDVHLVSGSEDALPEAAREARRRVVIVGDSLTAGYGLAHDEAYPALLQLRIDDEGLDAEVVNAGESGRTTSGGRSAIGWFLKQETAVCVIALGGNDALRGVPIAATRDNLVAMIETVRDRWPECAIVLAGMRAPPSMGRDYCDAFERIYVELAEEYDLELVPFLLDGVAAVRSLNQGDGIHPTAKGQEILAANVWPALEAALRDR